MFAVARVHAGHRTHQHHLDGLQMTVVCGLVAVTGAHIAGMPRS